MAIVYINGFDDATTAEPGDASSGNVAGRVLGRAFNKGSSSYLRLCTMPSLSEFWMGFAFKTGDMGTVPFMRFYAPDDTTIMFQVGMTASGQLTIYNTAGTVVATSSASGLLVATPTPVWTYLEVHAKIADSGGEIQIRANENAEVTFSGDTKFSTPTNCNFIRVRDTGGGSASFDDLYIDDAGYQGDCVVSQQVPNDNGDSSQWTGSDGNSIDNYLLVDEAASSSADHVAAAAASLTDFYQMTDLPAGYNPLAIQPLLYAAKSDAGTPPVLKPVIKGDGGTVVEGAAMTLSTTYQLLPGALRTTDPDGDALTRANVNAMQIGVRSA